MTKIQEIRKKCGLTQQEIANKLGISQQAYGNYERDALSIPSKMMDKIAKILMIDPSQLIYEPELENDSITEFLHKSLTAYHAVRHAITLLEKEGFKELKETESWSIKEGDKYYVSKNRSALIAFIVGDLSHYAFNIASCHTDSPALKIKGRGLVDSVEGKRINVERYGGLINYTFLDIPLKIGGRVFIEKEDGLEERIISSDFNVNIPSLAIHHNPTVNEGIELKIQNDMLPLLGKCEDLYQALLPNEKIVDGDLYCVPFVKPTYTGLDSEFLVSPRIDNLTSFYAIIKAISEINTNGISMLYASDNEEVGSLSKQGAESIFLSNVLDRINVALNKTKDDFYKAIANGFMLSIDNGHAAHPAHPEKSDPLVMAKLNQGVVIKHHPNYATDGFTSALIKTIAKKNDILVQDYYNNSDVRCGSTIGLVNSAQLGINTCDIGLAQLAMHSGIETVGKYDIQRMIKLVKCFFETNIEINEKQTLVK